MTWWEAHRPSKRKLIQLYSALLYNAHLRGFIDGEIYQVKAKAVCVPGFNLTATPAPAPPEPALWARSRTRSPIPDTAPDGMFWVLS